MSQLNEQIGQLKSQLRQLIKQYNQLQKESSRLKLELEKKEKLLAAKEQEFIRLQPHADAIKLETGLLAEDEKKELSKRIEAYIKEIDQCLALLNQ
jgi:regulator of replication initiation timing